MRTPEEQLEWDLCKNDCVYFLNKYLQPEKYSPLLADFKLYPFQEDVLDAVEKGEFIVINTSRQMGISTILTGRALWKMLFNDSYAAVFINPNLVQGIRHIDMIKDFYNQLPKMFQIGLERPTNKRSLALTNGSSVSTFSPKTGSCSRAFDEIVFDQASYIKDLESIVGAAQPLLYSGKNKGKMIVTSCLYKEDWFTQMCRKAEKGDFDFTYIKLPYWVHPKRGRAWRSQQDKDVKPDYAKLECDCSYVFTKEGVLVPLNDE